MLSLFLNKNKSKKSINKDKSLATNLISSKRLIPIDPISSTISEIKVYNEEREKCNNIRLSIEVNPICSNVLFNNITEIVKDEGTENVKCLNYNITPNDFKKIKFKSINNFTNEDRVANAIRDTQINNSYNNFVYHCGIDIFNNHLLRSKTFKTVCPLKSEGEKNDNFNTISDYMRNYDGDNISGYTDSINSQSNGRPDIKMHLYLNEEIMSFKESITNNLKEENGWFGFTNVGKMKVYPNDNVNDKNLYEWFNVINTKKSCDFIEMYPEKKLFFFEPKYNNFKKRIEKNWHYCLTYPSSSTTENITFIDDDEKTNSTTLKAIFFDDTTKYNNGIDSIKIYSISKHGLKKGDIVNIYNRYIEDDDTFTTKHLIIKNAEVIGIENEYIFYVYKNGINISKKWLDVSLNDDVNKVNEEASISIVSDGKSEEYKISSDRKKLTYNGKEYFIIEGKKVNIDDKAQDISYAKVTDGNEVKYYVRIFSKIPNWKFGKYKVDDEILTNEKYKDYVKECQQVENEFESHIGKLAFSKNIYNDNLGEIVFSDNIDINYLKDNIGRPVSEIYLTIIKNNEGYREWYGKNSPINISADNVEYSHCFGKLNCAFKLSKESIINNNYSNVLILNNVSNLNKNKGLNIKDINKDIREDISYIDDDEIQYNKYKNYCGDINYYGDLCCYSSALCYEEIIQDIDFRFNTAQREVTNDFESSEYFHKISYDEIIRDDYDYGKKFEVKTTVIGDDSINGSVSIRKEGYYYKPHYKIPIKTYSEDLTTKYPTFIKIKSIKRETKKIDGKNIIVYDLITMQNHSLGTNDIIFIYDKINNILYKSKVKIDAFNLNDNGNYKINPRYLSLIVENDDLSLNNTDFLFFKKPYNIPDYAKIIMDGSCRYVWRELYQNGFDSNSDNEIYPFTNNALYINKRLNLFLKRQNPECLGELKALNYPFDIPSTDKHYETENKYYNEKDIEC